MLLNLTSSTAGIGIGKNDGILKATHILYIENEVTKIAILCKCQVRCKCHFTLTNELRKLSDHDTL